MPDWPEYPLGEVTFFQEGPGILAKDFKENGTPLVRLAGLGGYQVTLNKCNFVSDEKVSTKWKHFQLEIGDILVSTSASFGRPAVVGPEAEGAIFYTGIIRFRSSSERLDDGYLKLFLGSKKFELQAEAYASGSVIRHFGPSHLRQMTIQIPSRKFQRQIADLIGTLDDKIELNRRTNETLEAMARAIFKDWFVDFGPTRAKMAGHAPYLAPDLWALFPDRLDDKTGLPEGWSSRKIGDAVKRLKVGNLYNQKTVLPAGKVPVLDQGKQGVIGFHNNAANITANPVRRVSVFANHTCSQRLMQESFSTIQNVIPFVGKDLPTEWCHFASLGKQEFEEYRGHWPSFVEKVIVVPIQDLAIEFSNAVSPLLSKKYSMSIESRTLAQTRDLLLPKLMSGELRVCELKELAEEMVE